MSIYDPLREKYRTEKAISFSISLVLSREDKLRTISLTKFNTKFLMVLTSVEIEQEF